MEDTLTEVAKIFIFIALVLFGHAGLWATIASVISGIICIIIFCIVALVCFPVACSLRLKRWPSRVAKTVLGIQALIVSWVIMAIVGVVCQDVWQVPLVLTMIPTFLLVFSCQLALIIRLGRKRMKNTEQDSSTPDGAD